MSNSKFVPLAIIAIMSATAVSQVHAFPPTNSLQYSFLAQYPNRDALNGGVETPAGKLGLVRAYGAAPVGSAGPSFQLQANDAHNLVMDTSVAAAAQPHRSHFAERAQVKAHAKLLNSYAYAPANAPSRPPAVYYDATPPRYDDPSKFGGQSLGATP